MAITISTHNGSRYSRLHNIRNQKLVENENRAWARKHPGELRIDPHGVSEIWHDEELFDVYERLFGESIREWNSRQLAQGKSDRVIENYLSSIKAKETASKNAKHPAYEMIFAIGSKEHPVDDTTAKTILREHVNGFRKRNPNLYVTGIYLHLDEVGVPHVHLDYVPVARNCKRGPQVQNSLTQALEEQGLKSYKKTITAQMMFERQENDALESVCNKYGFEVDHPQRGTRQEHLTVEEYKLTQDISLRQAEIEEMKGLPLGKTVISKARLEQLEQMERAFLTSKPKIEEARRDRIRAAELMAAYIRAYATFQADREHFDQRVNEAANKKVDALRDDAMMFIKQNGMWETFDSWVKTAKQKLALGQHI